MAPTNEELVTAVAHSKLKIEWAKNHINGVEGIVNRIVEDNPDVIAINNDLQAGIATITIGPKQFIPASLVLHLGDAIHNLNGVMDFLWSGLARSCNATVKSKVTFPRQQTRQNLEAQFIEPKGNDAAIYAAFPKAKSFVADAVQPYEGGNGSIWNLNKLDNINKHRILILATHLISFDRDLVFVGADGGIVRQGSGAAIQTQGYPLKIGLTPPVQIHDYPKSTISVVFGEPDHFTGKPVVETLVNLVEATTEVVHQFEKTFL